MHLRRVDVVKLLKRILAVPMSARALHGCPCPDTVVREEVPGEVTKGPHLAWLTESVAQRACDSACAAVGGRCELESLRGDLSSFACTVLTFDARPDGGEADGGPLEDAGSADATTPTSSHVSVRGIELRDRPELARWIGFRGEGAACSELCSGGTGRHADRCSVTGTFLTLNDHEVVCETLPSFRPTTRHCAGGRPPAGHVFLAEPEGGSEIAAYWLAMEHLERASVAAFEDLAGELATCGAPDELVARARRAARDEVEHATACAEELARLGARPAEQARSAAGQRDLLALAIDNAREGCVRETFGALLAAHQAERAHGPEHRRLFAKIAGDEAAHGQLAWDLHAWALSVLDAEGRAAVLGALHEELAALAVEPRPGRPPEELGLPAPDEHVALARAFAASCGRLARALTRSTAGARTLAWSTR